MKQNSLETDHILGTLILYATEMFHSCGKVKLYFFYFYISTNSGQSLQFSRWSLFSLHRVCTSETFLMPPITTNTVMRDANSYDEMLKHVTLMAQSSHF